MKGSWYPRLVVGRGHESLVSSSGAVLLREAVRLSGLDAVLSDALAPWRSDRALHDPAKVLVDEAMVLALGGDCMADLAVLAAGALIDANLDDEKNRGLVDDLISRIPESN